MNLRTDLFEIPAPDQDRDEAPRMVVALWMPVWRVQLVQVDVEPRTLQQLVSSEFLPDLRPAYFFVWYVTPQELLEPCHLELS